MKKKNLKICLGKALSTLSVLGLSASLLVGFAGCSNGETLSLDESTTSTYPLLSREAIVSELEEQYGEDNGMIVGEYRLPRSIESDSTKVNINFETSEKQKELLEYCLKDINNIFSFVNSKYKFELKLSPSEKDKQDPYAIGVSAGSSKDIEEKNLPAVTYTLKDIDENIDGQEIYAPTILLAQEKLDDEVYLMHEFKSALATILGLEKPSEDKDSILKENKTSFSNEDITLLYSFYRSPEKVYDKEGLANFMEFYATGYSYNDRFADKLTNFLQDEKNKDFLLARLADDINFRYDEIENITQKISNNDIDKDFGKEDAFFIGPVRKVSFYKPYTHYSISNGMFSATKFALNDQLQPFIIENKTIEYSTSNGVVVARSDNEVSVIIKVDDYIITLNSTLTNPSASCEEIVQASSPTIYRMTEHDYNSYTQYLRDEHKQSNTLEQQ